MNAAGASLMPRPVLDAVSGHVALEGAVGGYEAQRAATASVSDAYAAVAATLNATPAEIAFCDSGSRAWAMALHSVTFRPGDRVLVTECEYLGNYVTLRHLASRLGVSVEVVPHGEDGSLDVDLLARRIDDRVRVVSVVHVPTNNGVVNPVEELGRIDRKRALLFVDACQSMGQLPLDVQAIGCDVLVATGRKYLRGPRGTAALYVARSALPSLEPLMLDTHSSTQSTDGVRPHESARRFETWETNVAANIGLGLAARYLAGVGVIPVRAAIDRRAECLREKLRAVPRVRVLDLGGVRSGLVTFEVRGARADVVWQMLVEAGFALDTCDVASTLLGHRFPGLTTALRASVHYYTSFAEIESFVDGVKYAIRRLLEAPCTIR